MKRAVFRTIEAADNQSGAMEAENHVKHGANPKSHMSRGNFVFCCSAFFAFFITTFFCISCSSTMKITEGSLGSLKGAENLHVTLNFDDAILKGKSEKTYLEMVQPQWVEGWEAAKSATFMESLLEPLNKKVRMQCGDFPQAQYQATVRVLSVNRKGAGKYLEGPGLRKVTCEVVFTKTGEAKPFARIKAKGDSKAKTSVFAPSELNTVMRIVGSAGSNTHLTGKAFGNVGQDLGKIISKKIK